MPFPTLVAGWPCWWFCGTNDFSFIFATSGELPLQEWKFDEADVSDNDTNGISSTLLDKAIKSLFNETEIVNFIDLITKELAEFDWRSASSDSLSDEQKTTKLVFRGSGGYRELRRQLLKHLMKEKEKIGRVAQELYAQLGFDV